MAKEHTVNLSCSFCGKSQREVRKLIAGPTVYICDVCIGLCNDIIAEEVSAPDTPLGARRCLEWEVEQQASRAAALLEIATLRVAEIPGHVHDAITRLSDASSGVQAAVEAWDSVHGPSPLPSWVTQILQRLSSTEEVVASLRAAVERSVPAERLATFDHILQKLASAKEDLTTGARAARPATPGAPS